MYYTHSIKPYQKRLPLYVDRTLGVQTWDLDNLYPQRMEEVYQGSYTTLSAVEALTSFIHGDGFTDPVLNSLVLNSKKQKASKILRMLAGDKAPHSSFALHFKYNANYKIASVEYLELKYNRFGIPDDADDVHDIKYCTNWERDPYKTTLRGAIDILTYPVFNPDPEVVRGQIEQYGGFFNYPGQILLWTPKPEKYPLASFDSVADPAQTQSEIGVFELSAIQNGFTAATIFKYPGTFANKEEEDEIYKKLRGFKGARNAKSILIVEAPGDAAEAELVESIQMQNTDKMFEFTDKRVKNTIRERFKMPMEILGHAPETGMFNKQQIQEAYEFYNTITGYHRTDISELFEIIIAHWWQPLAVSTFEITPLTYIKNGQTGQTSNNPSGNSAVSAGV